MYGDFQNQGPHFGGVIIAKVVVFWGLIHTAGWLEMPFCRAEDPSQNNSFVDHYLDVPVDCNLAFAWLAAFGELSTCLSGVNYFLSGLDGSFIVQRVPPYPRKTHILLS